MSKYVLAKDLPFAKAGEEIIKVDIPTGSVLSTFFVLKKDFYPNHKNLRCLAHASEEKRLISEGWIEEVEEEPKAESAMGWLANWQKKWNGLQDQVNKFQDEWVKKYCTEKPEAKKENKDFSDIMREFQKSARRNF